MKEKFENKIGNQCVRIIAESSINTVQTNALPVERRKKIKAMQLIIKRNVWQHQQISDFCKMSMRTKKKTHEKNEDM